MSIRDRQAAESERIRIRRLYRLPPEVQAPAKRQNGDRPVPRKGFEARYREKHFENGRAEMMP